MGDPFNLGGLRIDPTDVARFQPKFAQRGKWRRQFIQFPWTWVERLQSATRVSTYRLALLLIYESWRTGGRPIVLSNLMSQAERLSRRSKWNALAELERLGLVRVERRRRRSPRLVLLNLGRDQT